MEQEDRVVLVTGGGQGIGRGIARRLLANGMRVVIADLDRDAAMEAAEENPSPERVLAMETDVSDEASVQVAISRLIDRFGRLDGLVNNAGIACPAAPPLELLTLDQWQRIIATNLTGVFLCSKHAAPHLSRQGGAIVNIASTRALQSEADTEAYSASKGGVVALTHAMAISLGPRIRVNCISPGWIEVGDFQKRDRFREPNLRPEDHSQHPAGRVGRPEDVAEMVDFLLSSRSGFITGQNFIIDGGMTRRMIYAE